MKEKIELLSRLLREIEIDIGIRDADILVLKALLKAIQALDVDEINEFRIEFKKLEKVVASTEPKFGILNFQLALLSKTVKDLTCAKWKKNIQNKIKKILKDVKSSQKLILQNAEKINVEGKTILIHDHSHTVQDVLSHYKAIGKHFKIVIAEQDFEKTHSNIEKMHKAGIPFQVVPSYMLSHIHDFVDMVFVGAVTLKDSMEFVMAPGTHSIISEFHVAKVPVCTFLDTLKFSLWKSKKRDSIFIHRHIRQHCSQDIQYERIKYSHDRVPATFFEKIVTNEGVFNPRELKKIFGEKLKDYKKLN